MSNEIRHRGELLRIEFASFIHKFGVAPLPVPATWYALPLRLIVGFGFVQHGYAKLSRGADGFIAILQAIGVPFADLLGWATIIVEIVGGLLILVGRLCAHRCRGDDRGASGCDLHRPSSQRVQLDQAHVLRRGGRAFRPARL